MSKKRTRDEQIEDIQAKLDASRQARIELAARMSGKEAKEAKNHYSEFQEWWASNRKSYDRSKDLEEIIWPHLKAIGCNSPEKFEEGVSHFGLRKLK
jgi:hypothetical protein